MRDSEASPWIVKFFWSRFVSLEKLIEQVIFNLHNTSWIVYVSVCVYMFLSVVCYHSKFLAHCSGKSAAIKALLESFRTISVLLPQKLSCFLLCGIPKGGSWDLFGLSKGEWVGLLAHHSSTLCSFSSHVFKEVF